MHDSGLICLAGSSEKWCLSDVGGDLGLLWCVENKHLLIDLLIRTEICWFALFGQWCKGWGKYWIRTYINFIWFLPCDESSIAPLCQPEGNPVAPPYFLWWMIRTDITACSSLFTLLLKFLEEEKLVSDFDLVPFYFFLILFLWWSCPAWSGLAGHLAPTSWQPCSSSWSAPSAPLSDHDHWLLELGSLGWFSWVFLRCG
jgi:hypothetical protein